jgi:23S rRNA (uracil1939-C5)-methyltransferase
MTVPALYQTPTGEFVALSRQLGDNSPERRERAARGSDTLPFMPPKSGDILELDIDTLAYGGQGVARHEDFVVFVRRAVPGDRVRAQVVKKKRRYAEAKLLDLLSASPLRVPAPCGHEESCGGCEWQTIDYAAQLEFKQRQVAESLAHIGGLTGFEIEPIRGMDVPWRYRNKMEFSFGVGDDGELLLGLHKRGSWREVSETADIWLAPEDVNRARGGGGAARRGPGVRARLPRPGSARLLAGHAPGPAASPRRA